LPKRIEINRRASKGVVKMSENPGLPPSPYDQEIPHRFGTNDLLFNLALLNAVATGVLLWTQGIGVGACILAGLGFFALVMPLILAFARLLLVPTGLQGYYLTWTNAVLTLTLVALVAMTVLNLV
jgi:hypothetical protein